MIGYVHVLYEVEVDDNGRDLLNDSPEYRQREKKKTKNGVHR